MLAKKGLDWQGKDLVEIVAKSARWLRQAMSYSDGRGEPKKGVNDKPLDNGCEVKKWVDAKLLEALWCPWNKPAEEKWLWKDVVREDLALLGTPDDLWKKTCNWHFDPDNCPRCHAGGLLARVLLGPMDWLFYCEKKNAAEGTPLQWVVAKLYDQLGGVNIFRTLSDMESGDDYRVFQLLYRIPEADYKWFTDLMVDFSGLLRDTEGKREVDYCLVCNEKLCINKEGQEEVAEQVQTYAVHSILTIVKREIEIQSLRSQLASLNTPMISDQLSQRILTETTRSNRENALKRKSQGSADVPRCLESEAVTQVFTRNAEIDRAVERAKIVLQDHFVKSDSELPPGMEVALLNLLNDIGEKIHVDLRKKVKNGELFLWKITNYFIWLSALHPDLGSYTVRYAANYRLMPDADFGTENTPDRLRNPCFVIASRELPSARLLAGARVSLTHCLGPLEDYYAIKQAKRISAANARADVGTGMFHNLLQYIHSLQKHIGVLDNTLANVRRLAETNPLFYPVAEALDGSIETLADTYRFQKAVYRCLAAEEEDGISSLKEGQTRMLVPADRSILHCLRTALTAVHGAAYYIMHEGASSSYVGTGNLTMLRALSGCRFPDSEESIGTWDDRLNLDELKTRLRAGEFQNLLNKSVACSTIAETIEAYRAWGFDLRLNLIDQAHIPQDLDTLVVNELVLNALRGSSMARWKMMAECPSVLAVVSIHCDNSCLTITNTGLPHSIERALRPIKRPIGQASGWGQWATKKLLGLLGLQAMTPEKVTIDGRDALRTTIRWGV